MVNIVPTQVYLKIQKQLMELTVAFARCLDGYCVGEYDDVGMFTCLSLLFRDCDLHQPYPHEFNDSKRVLEQFRTVADSMVRWRANLDSLEDLDKLLDSLEALARNIGLTELEQEVAMTRQEGAEQKLEWDDKVIDVWRLLDGVNGVIFQNLENVGTSHLEAQF